MTRSRASAKAAGQRFETDIATYLATHIDGPQKRETTFDLVEYRTKPSSAGHTERLLTHPIRLRRTEGFMKPNSKTCVGCQASLSGHRNKWCSDECRTENYNNSRRRPRAIRSPGDRVREKAARGESGCLEFHGHRNACGYGVIQTGGNQVSKTALAHRIIWAEKHGPIPEGAVIRHRCDNPACVELGHLEIGTHLDNMRDRDIRGRTLKGEQTARHKLTWEQVQEIRELCRERVPQVEIARRFGISKAHVSYIKNFKTRAVA